MPWLFRLLTLPIFALATWLAWLPWGVERYVARLESGEIPLAEARDWPLHFEPSLAAARLMATDGRFPLERIRGHLQAAIDRRPAYAPAWLDLAELELRAGDRQLALAHAQRSQALWPTRRIHLWRLAQFYLRLGEVDLALPTLSVCLLADPAKADAALGILRRLEVPTGEIVAALADPPVAGGGLFDAMALAVFRAAARQEDLPFLNAWTDAVPPSSRVDPAWNGTLERLGFQLLDPELICKAFDARPDPRPPCLDTLRDPTLTEPYTDDRLAWSTRRGDGFEVRRRDEGGIAVVFDGSTNLQFRHLSQWAPLSGAGRYRLMLRTAGRGITTRFGVYWEVNLTCEDGRRSVASIPRTASWSPDSETVDFEVPDGCSLAQIILSRDRSTDLDNRLAGTVHVERVDLTRLPPVPD